MGDHTNCDCNHDQEPVIYVTFEGEDEDVACTVLGIFDVEGQEYIALMARDTEDDILLYRFSELDDQLNLGEIETDQEYEKVAAAFERDFFDEDERPEDD